MLTLVGPIEPGDEVAELLGFTPDLFEGYLFADPDTVMISVVLSLKPRQGNFSEFVDRLLRQGFTVKVPTPMPQMRCFLVKHGFEQTCEFDEFHGEVEVWVKSPTAQLSTLQTTTRPATPAIKSLQCE